MREPLRGSGLLSEDADGPTCKHNPVSSISLQRRRLYSAEAPQSTPGDNSMSRSRASRRPLRSRATRERSRRVPPPRLFSWGLPRRPGAAAGPLCCVCGGGSTRGDRVLLSCPRLRPTSLPLGCSTCVWNRFVRLESIRGRISLCPPRVCIGPSAFTANAQISDATPTGCAPPPPPLTASLSRVARAGGGRT